MLGQQELTLNLFAMTLSRIDDDNGGVDIDVDSGNGTEDDDVDDDNLSI